MVSAVVLAAGEGRGAWPFCGVRQKVTVPVLNVPLVRRLVQDLVAAGVREVVVVTGHRAPAVRACLADLAGVRFTAQAARGGEVEAAIQGVGEATGDDVVLSCGDVVTTARTVQALVDSGRRRRGTAQVLTAPVAAGAVHWNSVHQGPDGLVTGIECRGDRSLPAFAGMAFAPREALLRALLRHPGPAPTLGVGAMPAVEGDLAYAFELLREGGCEVAGVAAPDFVVDVDRPWDILEANERAARHAIGGLERTVLGEGASIHDGADIAPDAWLVLGRNAHVGKGCRIGGPVILGDGARVIDGALVGAGVVVGNDTVCREYCKVSDGAVLGQRCIVSHGAEFTGVMFDTVYLYHYCCITALLGAHVDIGAAAVCGTWRFDDGVRPQAVKGHTETPAHHGDYTYIGDYCRTGVNTMFMPGVRVGAYSCVGPGVVVYEDVPEHTLLLVKQEHVKKEWGPERYGW